tara:strand:- start:1961 stop:2191 length:231 start_codon:yes stop_codon:yes gene_type:complete
VCEICEQISGRLQDLVRATSEASIAMPTAAFVMMWGMVKLALAHEDYDHVEEITENILSKIESDVTEMSFRGINLE